MISGSHLVVNAPSLQELSPHCGCELTSAVSRDGFGNAEGADPSVRESVDYRIGADVFERDGGRPAREAVDQREEIVVPLRFWHHCNIRVDVGETAIGY